MLPEKPQPLTVTMSDAATLWWRPKPALPAHLRSLPETETHILIDAEWSLVYDQYRTERDWA